MEPPPHKTSVFPSVSHPITYIWNTHKELQFLERLDVKPIFWVINGKLDRLARGNFSFDSYARVSFC